MLTRAPSAGSVMSRGPLQNEFAATGARTGGRGYLPGRGMDRARTYMRKESSNVHSKTRAHANCDDSATWATRNAAESWALEGPDRSVGIVLTQANNETCLCGIDLDACRQDCRRHGAMGPRSD